MISLLLKCLLLFSFDALLLGKCPAHPGDLATQALVLFLELVHLQAVCCHLHFLKFVHNLPILQFRILLLLLEFLHLVILSKEGSRSLSQLLLNVT